jgi:hypothetical protein
LVAASGIPSVTVTNVEIPTQDSTFASHGEPSQPRTVPARRVRAIAAISKTAATTCPTVVNARVTFESGSGLPGQECAPPA